MTVAQIISHGHHDDATSAGIESAGRITGMTQMISEILITDK